MKIRTSTKPKGILSDILTIRPMGAREKEIVSGADRIRRQHSLQGRVGSAIREIRDYVLVSKHPTPTKIRNLQADLDRVENTAIERELKKAIAQLQAAGRRTQRSD